MSAVETKQTGVNTEPGLTVPRKLYDRLAVIGLFIATMAVWEFGTRWSGVPSYVVPPPSAIVGALYRGFSSGLYLEHLWYTLYATVVGFVVGSLVGVILGALIASFRYVDLLVYPYVIMLKSMPKVALAPLFTLWFGLGLPSKVVSAAIICFFPLMVNTISGLKSADEDRISLMKSMGASKWQIFRFLRFPSALPYIMAGLEVAVVLALIGTIVAEFVGARAGLGTLIQNMNYNMDGAGQFSVLIILSAIGLTMNILVRKLKKYVLFWDPSAQQEESATPQG